MNEIQPVLDSLSFQSGWPSALINWMVAVRIGVKPFGDALQRKLTDAVVGIAASGDEDDAPMRRFILGTLRNPAYRVFQWLVDLFVSVKLPTLRTYKTHLAIANQNPLQTP